MNRQAAFDLVGAREERRVAEHGVEDEPLVGLGAAAAEGRPVAEVHRHRAERHRRPRHLGHEAQADALVGLDADGEHVGSTSDRRPRAGRSRGIGHVRACARRACGTLLKWTLISVTRLVRRLPARM